MNTKLVILLLLVLGFTQVYSQNVKNNLYILIDKEEDSIVESLDSNFKFKYFFKNPNKNWQMRMVHKYSDDHGMRNHYPI